MLLAQTYVSLGRTLEADAARQRSLRIIEKHLEFHPEDARALYLGASALIQVGQRDRALEWTHRALAVDPEDPAVLYNVACTHARLGMTDQAVACLEKALQQGEWYKAWAEHDSDLDSIRTDSRFQALLKSI